MVRQPYSVAVLSTEGGYIPCPFERASTWEWVKNHPAGAVTYKGTEGSVKTFTFTENISYSSMLLISFLNEVKILAATISLFL